ncbi:MAG: Rrf2 family transcriptional regulator [Coxiella endosymbiont of Haemaphysalis qinghaiensis]
MARPPEAISIAEIINAIDGNPAMTKCSQSENQCEHYIVCG